jgi:hypothetical protein
MTDSEWLNEVALGHAIQNLKRQTGFSIATRSHLMVQFSPDYRNGNRPGTVPKSAFSQEVGPRVWLHDEVDWTRGKA